MVYKAHLQWHLDATTTEVVVVKTLKRILLATIFNNSTIPLATSSAIPSGLFTPNDVDSLVQEVLKMHTLSHPNVCH